MSVKALSVHLLVLLVYTCTAQDAISPSRWEFFSGSSVLNYSGSSSSPPAAGYQCSDYANDTLFIFGGQNNRGFLSRTLWRFNLRLNLWTSYNISADAVSFLSDGGNYNASRGILFPGSRKSCGLAALDSSTVLLFGGFGYANSSQVNCDGNISWPAARAGFGFSRSSSTQGYLFGGIGFLDSVFNDMWRFSSAGFTLASNSVANRLNHPGNYPTLSGLNFSTQFFPSGRSDFAWCRSSSFIFIFGGLSVNTALSNELWAFDLSSRQWAWISGNSTSQITEASYSRTLFESPLNFPSSQSNSICWSDGVNLYLYSTSNTNFGDLWRVNIYSSKFWVHLKSNTTQYASGRSIEAFPGLRKQASVAVGTSNPNLAFIYGGIRDSNYLADGWIFDRNSMSVNQSLCLQHPITYFADSVPSSEPVFCKDCLSGSYYNSQQYLCISCNSGTYTQSFSTNCTICSLGRYSLEGSTECRLCETGFFANSTGSSSCISCPLGRFSNDSGASTCSNCPAGKFSLTFNATMCSLCSKGSYSSSNSSLNCSLCDPGMFSTSQGMSSCTVCPFGTYSDEFGSVNCSSCSPGKFTDSTSSTSCIECPTGKYSASENSSSCTSCLPGKYSLENSSSVCIDCTQGSYSSSFESTSCIDCSSGRYTSSASSTSCVSCSAGKYATLVRSSVCLECIPGQYSAFNSSASCLDCPSGTYSSQSGSTKCDTCASGTYSDLSSSSTCMKCVPGMFNNITGETKCMFCSLGTYSQAQGRTFCEACTPGYFSDRNGQPCSLCPEGRYNLNSGLSTCLLCPLLRYCVKGTVNPLPCSPGYFANELGLSACFECENGTFSLGLTELCSNCSRGYFSTAGQSSCSECPIGKFSNETRAPQCLNCGPGRYGTSLNSTFCSLCPEGKSSFEGSSTCYSCSPGKYSMVDSICLDCPLGFWSYLGNSTCYACSPGKFRDRLTSGCTQCSMGKYSFESNQTACFDCPPGQYGTQEGVSECQFCSRGRYSDLEGSTFCSDCREGSFSIQNGASSCLLCEIGQEMRFPASTFCQNCNPGTYSNLIGTSSCDFCMKGSFSESHGSTECSNCSEYSTTSYPGSTSSSMCICAENYYRLNGASPFCSPCPDVAGASCPEGSVGFLVEPGYFRISDDPPQTVVCVPQEACSYSGNGTTVCSLGYTGFACGSCVPYFFYRNNGVCAACPGDTQKWVTVGGALIVLAVLFWLLFFHGLYIPTDFKITLQTVQLLSVFTIISDEWPPVLANLLKSFSFVNFNIELFSPECSVPVSFWTKYYIKMITPLMGTFGTISIYGVWVAVRHFLIPKIFHLRRHFQVEKALERVYSLFGTVITATYTLIISNAFSPFDCVEQKNGSFLMRKNSSQYCYDKEWQSNMPMVIVFLVSYGLLLPLGLGIKFFMQRKKVDNLQFQTRFRSLISSYRREYFFWELVTMLKRASIFVALEFLTSVPFATKFFSILLMMLFFFCLDAIFVPYASRYLNVLASLSHLIAIIVLSSIGLLFGQTHGVSTVQRTFFDILLVVLIVMSLMFVVVKKIRDHFQGTKYLTVSPQVLSFLTQEERDSVYSAVYSSLLSQGEQLEVDSVFMQKMLGNRYLEISHKLFVTGVVTSTPSALHTDQRERPNGEANGITSPFEVTSFIVEEETRSNDRHKSTITQI